MSRNDLLLVAAVIVAVAGFVHSYLGERLVFPRLFALADLPLLRRDRIYTENVLRYAWHVTSLAWWAVGAILIAFWWGDAGVGHSAEALAELEQCVKRRGEATDAFFSDMPTLRYLPTAYYYLARAQEGLGATMLVIEAPFRPHPLPMSTNRWACVRSSTAAAR